MEQKEEHSCEDKTEADEAEHAEAKSLTMASTECWKAFAKRGRKDRQLLCRAMRSAQTLVVILARMMDGRMEGSGFYFGKQRKEEIST
jgi:hypothetical protein